MSGTYQVISADCPWKFSDKRPKHGGCERHYKTMTALEIAALPVEHTLAAPHCVLFLWAPAALTPDGLMVLRAWGFRFATLAFVWVKRGASGKIQIGPGAWTRPSTELCWLGVRGKPKVASHSVYQLLEAPRGEHSAKPPECLERMVKLCGDVPRVEMFARTATPGWSRFGTEAPDGAGRLELVRLS